MASAANSLPENQPRRVQLSLLPDGDPEEIKAPGVHSAGAPEADAQRAARGGKSKAKAPQEPPPPAEKVAEALAELQRTDAIGLELAAGKKPTIKACKAAGLGVSWGSTRWQEIKDLEPAALAENQLAKATELAELRASMERPKVQRASRTELTDADRTWLESRGITGRRQEAVTRIRLASDLPPGFSGWGEKAVPCLCFRWESIDERAYFQLRPDTPIEDEDGGVHKYLFAKGHQNVLAVPPGCRDLVLDPGVDLLVCEGTKQHLAAASAMEGERLAVLGTAGCWGHRIGREDQSSALVPCFQKIPLEGRRVWLLLDADRQTNRLVYDAAQDQHDALVMLFGAAAVRFVKVPGSGTADLDDLLSQYASQEERKKVLRRLLDNATDKQGREPNRKTAKTRPFIDMDSGKLAVADLWEALLDRHPIGVHNVGENKASLLVYRNGMFHNGKEREFENSVTVLLGNGFEPRHLSNVREFAISRLVQRGAVISARQPRLWINFRNGVLDVLTLELEPHNPARHAFLNQVPYDWNPAAVCPYYEEWIEDRIPGQVAVYEDAISQVLDWRKETMKAPFLFGPESTGKTTALWFPRLLIGEKNMAKLSLQEIGHNDFAAAELAGKLLNICGDLERDEIRSLATFKQLTGGDGKTANKKFGDFVDLDWIGTFMFSANTIPSVSGDPGSYLKRVQPIWFRKTYTGNEKPEIGERLRERSEIEGVIVRLVTALREHELRGGYLKPEPDAASHFGSRSDQVRRFLSACTITVPHKDGEEKAVILEAFDRWARDNQCGMGRNNFYSRLDSLGIQAKKVKDVTGRRFPLALRDEEDWDSYDDTDPPEDPDPSEKPEKGSESRFPLLVPTFSGPNRGSEPLAPQAVPTIPAFEGKGVSVSSVEASGLRSTEKLGGLKNREYREPPVAATDLKAKTAKQNREPKVGTTETPTVPLGLLEQLRELPPTPPPPADELVPADHIGPLVLDLETRSADLLFAPSAQPFVTLAGTPYGLNADPSALADHANNGGTLVAHNGFTFDFQVLAHHHGMDMAAAADQGRLIDTMLLATFREKRKFSGKPQADTGRNMRETWSLDAICKRIRHPGKTNDIAALALAAAKAHRITGNKEQKVAAGLDLIHPGDPELQDYLRGDITALGAIAHRYGGLSDFELSEMRYIGLLSVGTTLTGIRIDTELLAQRKAERDVVLEANKQRLIEEFGLPATKKDGTPAANPLRCAGAGAAIDRAWASLCDDPLPRTPSSGDPITNKETRLGYIEDLQRQLADEGLTPEVRDNLQARIDFWEVVGMVNGATHVYGSIDKALVGDRVHPRVQAIQLSGRTSTTDPGMTVFGKRGEALLAQRALVLPDNPDNVLFCADLRQGDPRAMAVHSQDPAYMALFRPGLDPATNKPRDAHQGVADDVRLPRSTAKCVHNGSLYGLGAAGVTSRYGVSEADAAQFFREFGRAYQRMEIWRNNLRRKAERGDPIDNGLGRRINGEVGRAYTQAPALLGQSTTRDLLKLCYLNLPLEIRMMCRLQVHDELVFSLPRDRAQEIKELILETMTFQWAPSDGMTPIWVQPSGTGFGDNWAACYATPETFRLVDEETGERFWWEDGKRLD